jgi:hypothetical protein
VKRINHLTGLFKDISGPNVKINLEACPELIEQIKHKE